ncbi:SPX domain-containing protein [Radiomyces spectabilis]|uniref:SPX domain-containing protein n=1 Tax=Radiomyces spectabilis TaxID=64574 RepID=UPI00221E3BC4|nr:SPX domain-containing protein [Radiomyces spectabilis]KAI8381110.1 SPX domain-containing protein [Radiomyces spectabilis]
MKFAKQIQTAASDLPEDWRPHLIQYKTLKKSIRSVVDELESRGLTSHLLTIQNDKNPIDERIQLAYTFDGDDKDPHPVIKVTIKDPQSICTARQSIAYLEHILEDMSVHQDETSQPLLFTIELVKDSEFFQLLLDELQHVAHLHDVEQRRFTENVNDLEQRLTLAASPYKKDLYVWREIFQLYMEASIFETNHGCHVISYEKSKERFQWLGQELIRQKLTKKLSSKQSRLALAQFMALNAKLVDFKYFQSLNQMAMTKILKKHDKRSGLCAKSEFPYLAKVNALFVRGIVLSLYNGIQSKIITIVPQPDDYGCPVCLAIAWRPIRLVCGHVFCVRCLIKAHRKRLLNCPICRQEHAVGNADANNLDQSLQNFMLLYFPREIKEKRRENEREHMTLHISPGIHVTSTRPVRQSTQVNDCHHRNCTLM